jgi:hypothetical protein
MERERGEVRKVGGFLIAVAGCGTLIAMLSLAGSFFHPHTIGALLSWVAASWAIAALFLVSLWLAIVGIEWMLDLS